MVLSRSYFGETAAEIGRVRGGNLIFFAVGVAICSGDGVKEGK